jgi:hypothetical protein
LHDDAPVEGHRSFPGRAQALRVHPVQADVCHQQGGGEDAYMGLHQAQKKEAEPHTLVGVVGIGEMGTPMARKIMQAGFPLIAYDVRRERLDVIAAEGAQASASASDVARSAQVVITMLPSPAIVRSVVEEEICPNLRSGQTVVEMSTTDVSTAVEPRLSTRPSGVPQTRSRRERLGSLRAAIGMRLTRVHRCLTPSRRR